MTPYTQISLRTGKTMIEESALESFRDMWISELKHMARREPLFTQWLAARSEVVKLACSSNVPDIAGAISRFVAKYRPQIKQCWSNSAECALALHKHGVEIVHGYWLTASGFPIRHAWNAYKNVHFDLTAESNNVEPCTEISVSYLEGIRNKPERHVKVHTFSLDDYLTLENQCQWPEWSVKYHASDIESGPYRVQYMPKNLLVRLLRRARKQKLVYEVDENRLGSLPDNAKCLVAFATRAKRCIRLGILLSALPRNNRNLDESAIATIQVGTSDYKTLPFTFKPRPSFMTKQKRWVTVQQNVTAR